MKKSILALVCAVAVAACTDPEAERQAQEAEAAQEKAVQEAKAAELGKLYDAAVAGEDWDRARLQAVALLDQYPQSEAAQRIEPEFEQIKAKGEAARELRRQQALWTYQQIPVGNKGVQRSAAMYSKQPVDVDGSGAKPVQLVFRDHPEWKRHAYLVLQAGDFAKACYSRCQVTLTVDEGTPKRMAAYRPDTDEAIAMFISDDKAMWKTTRKASTVKIEFPVKAGGTREVVFETAGLDGSQMPNWD